MDDAIVAGRRRPTEAVARCRCGRRGAVVMVLLVLAACGVEPELPPPGAEGGVLHLWRDGAERPAVITARRVRQQAGDVTLLRFYGVDATIPMPTGELRIASRAGTYDAVAMDQGGEPVVITRGDGPIRLGGREHGAPLAGRAEAGAIASERSALILEELDLVYRGRRYRVGRLRLDELFAQRSLVAFDGADGVRVAPAPPVWCAALGAIAGE